MSLSNEETRDNYFEEEMQTLLQEEVALSREVLSNLNQQEYVLLIGDTALSEELGKDYLSLKKQLTLFSQERNVKEQANTNKQFENSHIHIKLLNEELMALHDKIQKQMYLNQNLFNLIQAEGILSERSLRKLEKKSDSKKKTALITLDFPKRGE